MIAITQPGTLSAQKQTNPEGEGAQMLEESQNCGTENDQDASRQNEGSATFRGPIQLDFGVGNEHNLQLCKSCIEKQAALAPPKRPLSPYIFFSQEQRKILKVIHPLWSTKQVMKYLSRTWRRMTPDQIKRYKDMSDMDRDRFDLQRKIIKDGKNGGQKSEVLVFGECTCDQINPPMISAPEIISKDNQPVENQKEVLQKPIEKPTSDEIPAEQKSIAQESVCVQREKRSIQIGMSNDISSHQEGECKKPEDPLPSDFDDFGAGRRQTRMSTRKQFVPAVSSNKSKPEYKFRKDRKIVKKEAVTVLVKMNPQMIQSISNAGNPASNQNSQILKQQTQSRGEDSQQHSIPLIQPPANFTSQQNAAIQSSFKDSQHQNQNFFQNHNLNQYTPQTQQQQLFGNMYDPLSESHNSSLHATMVLCGGNQATVQHSFKQNDFNSQDNSFVGAPGPVYEQTQRMKHVIEQANNLVPETPNSDIMSHMNNNNQDSFNNQEIQQKEVEHVEPNSMMSELFASQPQHPVQGNYQHQFDDPQEVTYGIQVNQPANALNMQQNMLNSEPGQNQNYQMQTPLNYNYPL